MWIFSITRNFKITLYNYNEPRETIKWITLLHRHAFAVNKSIFNGIFVTACIQRSTLKACAQKLGNNYISKHNLS